MANITVSVPVSNITASATNTNVSVATTTSNVTVSSTATVGNSQIRSALSNSAPILYNVSTGVFSFDSNAAFSNSQANNWFTTQTTDNLTEGTTNLYFSTSGGSVDTDNLTEGTTNLYFTPARVRTNVSVTTTTASGNGALNYSNSTGVFQFTPAAVPQTTDDLAPGSNVERQYLSNAGLQPRFVQPGGILQDQNVNIGNVFSDANYADIVSTNTILTGGKADNHRGNLAIYHQPDVGGGTANVILMEMTANGNVHTYLDNEGNDNTDQKFRIYNKGNSEGFNYTFTAYAQGNVDIGNKSNAVNIQRFTFPGQTGTDPTAIIQAKNIEASNTLVNYIDFNDDSATPDTDNDNSITIGSITDVHVVIDTNDNEAALGNSFFTVSKSSSNLAVATTLFKVDSAGNANVTGNLNVAGDLEVTGNINYREVEDLLVQDQTITLNYGNASAQTSEIIVDRSGTGGGTNVSLRWNETSNIWEFSNDGSTYQAIPTSSISNADAKAYIESQGLSASANLTTTANISGAYILGDGSQLTGLTTTQVSEGTNLYYTTDRANSAIDAYQGNVNTAGTIDATGNITTDGFFIGDIDGAVVTDVRNESGVTLNKGKAVFLNGSNTGDTPHVELADADDSAKMPAIGIIRENISNASVGQAVTSGLLNVDGHGFTAGADLFISTTAGDLSETAPTGESGLIQKIGKVVGPNHILVQGAFRTNATPNLDEGKIFLGSSSNTAVSVTPDSNFVTTGNAFALSNTLSNIKQISPETDNQLDLYSVNNLRLFADKSSTNWNTGNVENTGSYGFQQSGGTGVIIAQYLTTNTDFTDRIGSTHVGGLFITKSGSFPAGIGGIDGSATFTAGSNVVQLVGLQAAVTGGFLGGGRTTADINTYFQAGMVIRTAVATDGVSAAENLNGTMPKNAYIVSVANSDVGGNANVIMSANAERTRTYSIAGLTEIISVTHSVVDDDGNRRAVHGVGSGYAASANDLKGMTVEDYQLEGIAENGANYFEKFTDTSMSGINANANVTPSMISTSNLTVRTPELIDMTSNDGNYRFRDSVLIGDQSTSSSRNNYLDTNEGFGLNIQWSGLGDTSRYGTTTLQPAMTFQNFTDNSLQSQSGFEDKAGPRVMLSSFTGNREDPWLNWYPRQGQDLGKFSWWSTTGQNPNPSTTVTPAAITAIAAHDWDVDANVSLDVIHYAQSKTANDQICFLKHAEDTSIGAVNGKKILLGQGGNIGSDVRANSDLTTEWANISSTGIYSGGVVEATGNITSSATISGEKTVLKQFNETVVSIGTLNGNIAANASCNAANGSVFTLTADGDITLSEIPNAEAGSSYTFIITQDGTGSRLLTSTFKYLDGEKTLTTAGGNTDIISVIYDGTNYYASLSKDYY